MKNRKHFSSYHHTQRAINDYASGKISLRQLLNRFYRIKYIEMEREWETKSLIGKFFTLVLRGIFIKGTGRLPNF